MKKLIFNILCNGITGTIILLLFGKRIPNLRHKGFRFTVSPSVEKRIAASVFFGFYESAEIRFVQKFFQGDIDVIELGASSGIVSAYITSRFTDNSKQLVSVEANEKLRSVWLENVRRTNRFDTTTILLNNAVYYDADSVSFFVSDNATESRVETGAGNRSNQVTVPAITLGKITAIHNMKEFALFCDIEGAEIQVLVNESEDTLLKCKHLFIELHETTYKGQRYSVAQLDELIQSKGFAVVEKHGPVIYYRNSK
jgi:FkbM family methyltransferase